MNKLLLRWLMVDASAPMALADDADLRGYDEIPVVEAAYPICQCDNWIFLLVRLVA